jgi:hypothetical protein
LGAGAAGHTNYCCHAGGCGYVDLIDNCSDPQYAAAVRCTANFTPAQLSPTLNSCVAVPGPAGAPGTTYCCKVAP